PERPHPFRPWSEAPKRNAWRGRAPVGAGSAAPAAGCRSPRRARLLGGDLLADLLERAPDQPRDVHLRDPDLRRDLRLRQPVEEPEAQDRALAVVQHPEARRQDGAVLGDLVGVLLDADRLERVDLLVLPAAKSGGQRQRAVRAPALERLQDLLLLDRRRSRELRDRRRAPQLHGQLFHQTRQLDVQLLEAARDAHGPAAVAEVPLDLADDVRRRVGRQLDAAGQVEAVDRLDQADRADLDQVVELLAAVRVAPRERADERHVLLDQPLARREIAALVVPPQQLPVSLVPPHRLPYLGIRSTRFRSSTQQPSPRSSTSTPSVTVASTRPRPRCASSSSSARSRSQSNGPTLRTSPSSPPSLIATVTSPPVPASSPSSATWTSSRLSNVRFSRTARPPTTRWATSWKSCSSGSVKTISSVTCRPPGAPRRDRAPCARRLPCRPARPRASPAWRRATTFRTRRRSRTRPASAPAASRRH